MRNQIKFFNLIFETMAPQILDFTEENGLVLSDRIDQVKNNSERLYISEVEELKAYAVLFRRYYKENEINDVPYKSEPAVCIFTEKDIPYNSEEHLRIHAALWSEGKVDVYIIYGKTRIDIYNARRPAEKTSEGLSVEKLFLASEIIDQINKSRFSAHLFGTGTFWEQKEFRDQLSIKDSPHIHLLNYLMLVRKAFLSSDRIRLSPSTIDKLLVMCIFVKFLEEIQDDDGKHTLKEIYIKYQVANFVEAINNHKLLDIIDELSSEFNGRIFDQFNEEEKQKIKKANLSLLSHFLSAKIDLTTQQYFLWEQYSFKHLPAEVISAIYENFIQTEAQRNNGQNEKGVVYTPIHLVNFLIDEVMPLEQPELFKDGHFRVLDPASGSGVFLVAAYKRLLQWWTIQNSTPNKIVYPDCKTAQKILEENVFGVDVKETAVLVSVFGLTTALLDRLTPKEIWSKLKFKDLSEKNIQRGSHPSGFFEWAAQARQNNITFDLIIGNPPFNPETGVSKKEVLIPEILSAIDIKHKKIPRGNFALHFFEASMTLSKKVCMIIPSNVLLYDKSAYQYRKQLFIDFTVSHIYDFTHLRRDLFHKAADTPVVALIAENKLSEHQPIHHTVVKRMVASEKKIRFEIDHYDQHFVKWEWAVDPDKQFVWKTNLLGGGRLFHLIYRLSLHENLKNLLSHKRKSQKWRYSIGYIVKHSNKKKVPCDFITGNEIIEAGTFTEFGEFNKTVEYADSFVEIREKKLFQGPHIIFKLVVEKLSIPMAFVDEYLCFNSSFVGISVPEQDREELFEIYTRLFRDKKLSKLYRAFILATSSKSAVYHETSMVKDDIDSLPYPQNTSYLQTSKSEIILIDEVLNFYRHLGKAITNNSSGAVLHKEVNHKQLREFGEVLCEELNDIYSKNGNSWQQGNVYQASSFTICQLGFGPDGKLEYNPLDEMDESIEKLINDFHSNRGTIYKRVLRIYDHKNGFDCIYFIKPNALRYWLKSIALRDADETFADFKEKGF